MLEKQITANIKIDNRWNCIPGISVSDNKVEIEIEKYFFRYEEPQWRMIEWDRVQSNWNNLDETQDCSLEQKCLTFVKEESLVTDKADKILENAELAYSFLFNPSRVDLSGLPNVKDYHLNIIKEASILMALNRVDQDGRARNVGSAWFLPTCTQKVFNLSDKEAEFVDELYHGTFFTEARRVDSVKAHTALGGRLVHGCQGAPNLSGGCVVEYGTSINNFHADLKSFRDQWVNVIQNF